MPKRWKIDIPEQKIEPSPPLFSPREYPLGTTATDDDGNKWVVEFDEQDRIHRWERILYE